MAQNFNTYTINHMMAKGLQRLYLEKRSERRHLKSLSDLCASFLQDIFQLYLRKGSALGRITASLGAHRCLG